MVPVLRPFESVRRIGFAPGRTVRGGRVRDAVFGTGGTALPVQHGSRDPVHRRDRCDR